MPLTTTVYTPTVSATLNGSPLVGVRKARVVSSFTDPVSKIYVSVYPAITWAEGDTITVTMGSGTNNVLSGTGNIYEADYMNNGPSFELVARGPLFKAQKYRNNVAGGLSLTDLTGGPATDEAIAKAVLTQAGVTYTPANIGGTGIIRGENAPTAYTWKQGETALDYLQRLTKASLGYRMIETIGGDVERVRVVGRPTDTATYSLEQGVDIFSGGHTQFDAFSRYTAVTVTGYDYGTGDGPVTYSDPISVPNGIDSYVYSSEMIEKADGAGVTCSTVALTFVKPEVDRVTIRVSGIKTPRDDLFEPGQTHQINADWLGLSDELLWCMSVTRECDGSWFSNTMEYLGGGDLNVIGEAPVGHSTFTLTLAPPARPRMRDYTYTYNGYIPRLVGQDEMIVSEQSYGLPNYAKPRDWGEYSLTDNGYIPQLIGKDAMIVGDQQFALPTYRRPRFMFDSDFPPASNSMLPFVTIGTTTSITNVTGTTAVYTFASPPAGVSIGSAVTVTGATPSVYNVSGAAVTNVSGNTFSVDIGSSGNSDASVQGTAVLL